MKMFAVKVAVAVAMVAAKNNGCDTMMAVLDTKTATAATMMMAPTENV